MLGLLWLTIPLFVHLFLVMVDEQVYQSNKRDEAREREDIAEAEYEARRRELMGTKTIRIELRYTTDKESDKAIREVARECARTMMASAMLISNGRLPQIAVTSEDLFAADEQTINLLGDDDTETVNTVEGAT